MILRPVQRHCLDVLVYFGVILLALFSSLFVFNHLLFTGHDLGYFLYRLDGIAQGFKDGNFPVRIHTSQINGYGYPTGIMFGDWFYYPAAFLLYKGFSITACYKLIIISVNIVTGLIAAYSFTKSFNSRFIAFAGTALWLFSYYRIEDITLRADIGEALALSFAPLLFLGIFRVLNNNCAIDGTQIRSCLKPWQVAGIAMAGIVTSNIPSTILTIVVSICLILIFIPIFRPNLKILLFEALKASLLTVALSAFYIVPFLDYYLTESFAYSVGGGNPGDPSSMAYHSVHIRQLFRFFQPMCGWSMGRAVSENWMPTTTGISLVVLPIFGLVLCFKNRFKSIRPLILPLLLVAGVFLIACTTIFPWESNFFVIKNLLTGIAKIQFPWRFLGPASFLLCLVSLIVASKLLYLARTDQKYYLLLLIVIVVLLSIAEGLYGMISFMDNMAPTSYEEIKQQDGGVYDAQFLPASTDVLKLLAESDQYPKSTTSIEFTGFSRIGSRCVFHLNANKSGYVVLPLLSYKYYSVKCDDSSLVLQLESGVNNLLMLKVSGSGSADVQISFEEPFIWRMAEFFSATSCLILICSLVYKSLFKTSNVI